MTARQMMLHNFRKVLGVPQLAATVRAFGDGVTQRLDALDARIGAAPGGPRPAPAPAGTTACELNGDPFRVPTDLLKFLIHTNVAAADDPVPKFLAETPHYVWVRDRLLPGDTVLDVGANIGLFTVMMANRVRYGLAGTVHALEPSPSVFRDLTQVVQANALPNVCLSRVAASDRVGTAMFMDIQAENVTREASHLAVAGRDEVTAGSDKNRVEVETTTIDAYCAFHKMNPQLIKIDVEGAEFLALEGGRQAIGRGHPFLVIEIHPDADGVFDHARLRKYLDQYGYAYKHKDKTYYCE